MKVVTRRPRHPKDIILLAITNNLTRKLPIVETSTAKQKSLRHHSLVVDIRPSTSAMSNLATKVPGMSNAPRHAQAMEVATSKLPQAINSK